MLIPALDTQRFRILVHPCRVSRPPRAFRNRAARVRAEASDGRPAVRYVARDSLA